MEIKKEKIKEGIAKALEDKGKRKFTQTMELIVNFRGIDFTKPENRLNLNIVLPKGKGKKENKVVVIGDESITHEAKKLGADKVFNIEEIGNVDAKELKKLAKDHFFIAHPKAMGLVAKHWGKVLGPRGKIPTPILGDLKKAIENARKLVKIQNKGKYMPVVQAGIGSEDMNVDDLVENAIAVLEEITKKIPQGNIKNVLFKLTMGKPVKVV